MRTNRTSFLSKFQDFGEGTHVYSSDGKSLGKVVSYDDDSITVQKGIFFPKDFTFSYDDIADCRDDNLYLSASEAELKDWQTDSYGGWNQVDEINTGRLDATPKDEYRDRYNDWSSEQIRVPVKEEELQATKTTRQAGNVRLHKVVHTELRHFTVPVMKEEIRIERGPVTDTETTAPGDVNRFEDQTINIPVMEEEVTISKRPVTKEEVRISKDRRVENREVEGEIKKEEVRIEGEADLKRKKIA